MKAKIKKENGKIEKNNNTSDKIILSVGMIVKNEEEHLDNCLSALKKLLDNVPSELIIVDTGSTDKTKEIAYKYTDKVYDFEWVNDFSAARNYGLKKAKGEWFMFVDADEYMDEKCDDMIKFFNIPELRNKYNSASYIIVDYSSKIGMGVTEEFLAPRLVKLTEDVEFHGAIHEWLPQKTPHGWFITKFHHYGYTFEDRETKEQKALRNMKPLLKDYEADPTNLRVLGQMCDATIFDTYFPTYEDKESYHIRYLEEAKKDPGTPYEISAYSKSVDFYVKYQKYGRAAELLNEFLQLEYSDKSIAIVSMYYKATFLWYKMNDIEKQYEAVKKYFEYYKQYSDNKLDMLYMRFETVQGITQNDYYQQLLHAAKCAALLKKNDEAKGYLDSMDISSLSFPLLRHYLNVVRDLLNNAKEYSYVSECFKKIVDLKDDDKTGIMLYMLQQYYLEHPYEREPFVDAMIGSGVDAKYIDLMKLVKADLEGEDITDEIQLFIDSVERWDDGYAEAIYLAMKHGADLSIPINKMSSKLIRENLQYIAEGHKDYPRVVVEYYDLEIFSESIKKLYWTVTAFEVGVEGSGELYHDEKSMYFDTFIIALSDYVMNIYNPDLLNPDDAEVLPELHRFGYFMALAFTAQNEGDQITYVRLLKEALKLCEPMKNVIEYYLSEFEKTMK